jgi:putative nucleotidyltransferase with HDIG domain
MYREKLNQVPSNRSAIIDTIVATINEKDEYSEIHSKRVSIIARKIAEVMELEESKISEIQTAGLLHDIGKIIVPSHILNKTTSLTNDEYNEMKKHSEIGYRILNSVSSMRDIATIVFCHHERIDGKGYPRGLKKEEIPFESRIISIADSIDAMMSDRLYRNKMTKEDCRKELIKHNGTQFCPIVIAKVLEHFDEICELTK